MSRLEYDGIWKIPEYEDLEVYGKLIVDKSITLKIVGELPLSINNENINIIHGYTTTGKLITLVGNTNIGSSFNYPGMNTYTYASEYVFIGILFNSLDELNINSISARYTYLEDWMNIYGFTVELNKVENFNLDLNYKLPNSINYKLLDFNLNINFRVNTNGNIKDFYSIKQSAFVEFSNLADNSFDRCINAVIEFSKFMSLCIGKNINFYDVKIENDNGDRIELYTRAYKQKEVESKKLMEHEIFIPYKYIEEQFGQCMYQWYNKKEKLRPIISYFLDICDITSYEPITFIKAMQALETFSRRMLANYKDNDEEHNKRIEYIMSNVDNEEYKEWLIKRLEFSNEPSLANRLNQILKETKFILNINEKKRKSIIKKLVDTRNYYTHFDESKKDKIMNSKEVIWSIKYILILLKVMLMVELGIDREMIKRRIYEVYREKYIIDEFSKTFRVNNI